MIDIQKQISQFVANQFPAIYREDGSNTVAFLTAYYEFLESNNKSSHYINRRLDEYSDIDETLDEFIIFFKKKYLADFPYLSSTDTRFLIKHIIEQYRSKGSEQSLKLFMQLLFGEIIEVYYPGQDMLKPSDSKWTTPQYIEVSSSDRSKTFLGKRIYSDRFNASGVVENVITKRVNGKIIDVIYLSDITGEFNTGDTVTDDGNLTGAPMVVGSLTLIEITDGKSNFNIGDILSVESQNGKDGTARVTSTLRQTDLISFKVEDGGFGYTLDSNTKIYITNSLLFMANPVELPIYSNVVQHLETLTLATANNVILGANIVHTSNTAIFGAVVDIANNMIIVNPRAGSFIGQTSVNINSNNYVVSNTVSSNTQGFVISNAADRVGVYRTSSYPVQFYGAAANTYDTYVQTTAGERRITRVGNGSGATFSIGSITDTQNITVNTNIIAPYLTTLLNATDYGFKPGGQSIANTINSSLSFINQTVGRIETLKGIDPGADYNANIPIIVDNPLVSAYDYKDYIINLSNVSRSFVVGDKVSQANAVFGIVQSVGTNKINVRNQTFGEIKFQANSTPIVSSRGATATIVSLSKNYSNANMGINALVTGLVTGTPGTIDTVQVITSGIGYNENDELVLKHKPSVNQQLNDQVVSGIARLGKSGVQSGYWETKTSHLNEVDIRIRDNKYYQEYSYDIIASESFDKYEKIVRDVLHVAGTKMFGSVSKVSTTGVQSTANTEIVIT